MLHICNKRNPNSVATFANLHSPLVNVRCHLPTKLSLEAMELGNVNDVSSLMALLLNSMRATEKWSL